VNPIVILFILIHIISVIIFPPRIILIAVPTHILIPIVIDCYCCSYCTENKNKNYCLISISRFMWYWCVMLRLCQDK
jgi:hypothetical protein